MVGKDEYMSKTYIRVDDRLIHGQTILAWCPTLAIKEIIAIDNESAKNSMLKSILTMSVPKEYRAHVVTTEEANELMKMKTEWNRLVIVKYPNNLQELKEEIANCEEIVLGNLAKRQDTPHQLAGATGIFFLSNQDIEEIDELVQLGIQVKFQQLPNTTVTSWETFKKSL